MALTLDKLKRMVIDLPVLSDEDYTANLESHGIVIDPDTGNLLVFDTVNLCFNEVAGLSDCTKLLTTRKEL